VTDPSTSMSVGGGKLWVWVSACSEGTDAGSATCANEQIQVMQERMQLSGWVFERGGGVGGCMLLIWVRGTSLGKGVLTCTQ
jgi:hypothetical protein